MTIQDNQVGDPRNAWAKMPALALFSVIAVATTMPLASCGKTTEAKPAAASPATAPAPEPLPVKARPAQARDLQRSVRIVGSLAGLENATLSNRVTGTVAKTHVDMGDRVKPNQVLLEIGPNRFEYALQEARAARAETLARLGLENIPGENFDINQTAPVKKAQTELDNAQSKLDRLVPLYKQNMVKQFEYIDAESARDVAKSAMQSSIDEARALLAQARQHDAQILIKQKDLRDATITAPEKSTSNGVPIESYAVIAKKVSTGEYLKEGTILYTLVADSTLKLQARVPERFLGQVVQGSRVNFHVEAYPGETFEGEVSRVDPSVDMASRTFMLEALVPNEAKYSNKLRPGSFAQGEVLTRKDTGRIMVPLESVISFVGVMKVFVVDTTSGAPRARSVEVATGQQEGQWVEILPASGEQNPIKAGDLIVYQGMRKLVEGGPVRLRETESVTKSD